MFTGIRTVFLNICLCNMNTDSGFVGRSFTCVKIHNSLIMATTTKTHTQYIKIWKPNSFIHSISNAKTTYYITRTSLPNTNITVFVNHRSELRCSINVPTILAPTVSVSTAILFIVTQSPKNSYEFRQIHTTRIREYRTYGTKMLFRLMRSYCRYNTFNNQRNEKKKRIIRSVVISAASR